MEEKILKPEKVSQVCIFPFGYRIHLKKWASLVTQTVKNLSAMWETQVQSLGREDPFEKGIYTDLIYLQNNHLLLFSQ